MNNITTNGNGVWINETIQLIQDLHSKKIKLETKLKDIKQELEELNKIIDGAEKLVSLYREKYGISTQIHDIKPDEFKDKTYSEILDEMARKNEGYLKITDVVSILVKSGKSGGDKRAIQANIYGTLKRIMKGRFVKLKPGQYRLIGYGQKNLDLVKETQSTQIPLNSP